MKRLNKIAIIGVGLIGGSIGLAAQKRKLSKEVAGYFRNAATLRRALGRKAVTSAHMDLRKAVSGAELIVICTPVRSIPAFVSDIATFAADNAVITDAGSTKAWIAKEVGRSVKFERGVEFVGSHPMAGSEKTGVEAAEAGLFDGAACIVTPQTAAQKKAARIVAAFWTALGARVTSLSPEEHDRAISLVSHLPHLAAFALTLMVPGKAARFAGEGYKDMTRIAASDPSLWADIFLTNRKAVVKDIREYEFVLSCLRTAIERGERGLLVKLLERSQKARKKSYGQ